MDVERLSKALCLSYGGSVQFEEYLTLISVIVSIFIKTACQTTVFQRQINPYILPACQQADQHSGVRHKIYESFTMMCLSKEQGTRKQMKCERCGCQFGLTEISQLCNTDAQLTVKRNGNG